MARILIVEPHADVRSLLEIVVTRLGHEPVVYEGSDPDPVVDCAVIEPGDGVGLELAQQLHDRDIPFVFTSIYPASAELLGLEPVTYLVKPFALYALERALSDAIESTAAPV